MRIVSSTLAALALSACSASSTPTPAPAPSKEAPVVVSQPTPPARDERAPVTVADPVRAEQGSGAQDAAGKLQSWGLVHALATAPIKLARATSGTDAVALTADNLVGVTTDGGAHWTFVRLNNGTALAISGAAGGPWIAVGKSGFAAWSTDGKTWGDLPRYTNEDLVAVAVDKASGATAITRTGVWVHWSADGKSGAAGLFPDKARPSAITAADGQFLALAGRTNYGAADGATWAALPAPTAAAAARGFWTAQGLCNLGKVDKNTGVVCEVKGQAYGLSDKLAVVPGKDVWLTTGDGGGTWNKAPAPMPSANGILISGSTIVAYGANGAVWKSGDAGKSWTTAATDLTKAWKAHWVDGATVVLAGDGGALARSTDGGQTFATVVTTATGGFKQVAKLDDGRLVASLGGKGIESSDGGASWVDMADPAPLKTLPAAPKAGKCDARQPAAGEICAYVHQTKSPAGLPNASGFSFAGENGLAWGDYGLLLMTPDGGKGWQVASGKGVRALDTFAIGKGQVIGTSGRTVVVSTDGGASWNTGELPKEAGRVRNVQVTSDGTLWIVGDNGTVIRGAGGTWVLCDVGNVAGGGKRPYQTIWAIHEAGGTPEAGPVLYAAGDRGTLWRSENKGDSWEFVATGTPDYIQKVAADGTTVVAATVASERRGNLLLKSDDGGHHFYVAREVSDRGDLDRLLLAGGTLTWNDRVSTDFGATWSRPADQKYWSGAIDLGDGSGLALINRADRYARDTTLLVGADKDDYVIIDATVTRGASFQCAKDMGCWMISAGEVFRPL